MQESKRVTGTFPAGITRVTRPVTGSSTPRVFFSRGWLHHGVPLALSSLVSRFSRELA
ncbi:MAG: hypothetical protein ACFFD4_21815 [Candidatus Odinarchaeota archaeon]